MMKKLNFVGFNVGALSNYDDQTRTELLTSLHFDGETASLANIQPGVKSSTELQLLATSPIPQSGTNCGFNASGSTAFTQRKIETKAVKYQDEFCLKTLEAKWTQLLLKKGANYTEADLPKVIMDETGMVIKEQLEVLDWQGDTTLFSAFLNKYDGLIKVIDNASGVVSATPAALNETNIRTILRNIRTKIPAAQKGKGGRIYCGYEVLDMYSNKLATDNLYNQTGDLAGNEIRVENSNLILHAVHGLDDTKRMFFIDFSRNAYLGVDLMNDEEDAKMWYSQDDDLVRYSIRFRRGWQIAFPAEIVEFTGS